MRTDFWPLHYISRTHDASVLRYTDCSLPCPHFIVGNIARLDELVGGLVQSRAILLRAVLQQFPLSYDSLRDCDGEHFFLRVFSVVYLRKHRTIWSDLPMRWHLPQPRNAGILIGRIRFEVVDHDPLLSPIISPSSPSVSFSSTMISARISSNVRKRCGL